LDPLNKCKFDLQIEPTQHFFLCTRFTHFVLSVPPNLIQITRSHDYVILTTVHVAVSWQSTPEWNFWNIKPHYGYTCNHTLLT